MKKLILVLCFAFAGQVYGQIDFEIDFVNERKELNKRSMELNAIQYGFYDNRTVYENFGRVIRDVNEVYSILELIDTHYTYYYGMKLGCENEPNWACARVKASVLYNIENESRKLRRTMRLYIPQAENLRDLVSFADRIIVQNTLDELTKVLKKIDGIVKEFDDIKK
tara:strand:+ start:110 stop:610 length:501 start_codon:yes stop_codon:yes gene_type:complete